jgi:integrase
MSSERVERIGLDKVRQLGEDAIIWETKLPGFGARRRRGGDAVRFFVYYRTQDGRQRWHTLGRWGALTPETARKRAKEILGEVAKGADPASEKKATREAMTVAVLCDAYLADAEAGRLLTRRRMPKKASTLATDRGRIERHIKPQLGSLAVRAVTRDDIKRFMYAIAEGETAARIRTKPRGLARVSGGKGTATRTVGLIGAIFTYAVDQKMRPDNPVRGIVRYADGRRERRLSDDEYAALGAVLRKAEEAVRKAEQEAALGIVVRKPEFPTIWPPAIAVTRFLVLTGWRSGEALSLRWSDVDLTRRTVTLADTKTGRSIRPLSHAACDLLRDPKVTGDLVFPPSHGTRMSYRGFWLRIAKLGGLPVGVTPHVLRHSFASLAADLGYSEPTIAALVGHKGHTVTSRYMHAADALLLAAADAAAHETARRMGETNA